MRVRLGLVLRPDDALQRLNSFASLFEIFRVKVYESVHHEERDGVRCAVLRFEVNDLVQRV